VIFDPLIEGKVPFLDPNFEFFSFKFLFDFKGFFFLLGLVCFGDSSVCSLLAMTAALLAMFSRTILIASKGVKLVSYGM
jgi:hypothetical protein